MQRKPIGTERGKRPAFLAALLPALLVLLLAFAPLPARADHESSEPSDGTVASFRWLNPPREPPPFQFLDTEGRVVTGKDFRGRIVLMNLWATWCAPCIREMPALDRLQAKFDKKDFLIVPVSLDKEGRPVVEAFYERLKLEHLDMYLDPEKGIEVAFPVDVLPANFLFDRQGRAMGYLRSFVDWEAPAAEAMIRALLQKAE